MEFWGNSYSFSDPDAAAYIAAVQAADGQALEAGVASAISAFVMGCKADGIWDAIKASCIMAGARTLAGALVPLKGPAPTNFNFVAGDYDRKTGLGTSINSNKYLHSNRNNNTDGRNNFHLATFMGDYLVAHAGNLIGKGGSTGQAGSSHIIAINNLGYDSRCRSAANSVEQGGVPRKGFLGISRASSTSYSFRRLGQTLSYSISSEAPADGNIQVFASGESNLFFRSKLTFYSIGEAIDLALLDARVTALMNALAAAIP